ncbi:MAG: Na+/H+ antiporter subunit D [Rhodobacteraceae bacterium]|nr:Na+/H+ antiporter subunit D [Paracoccaceae bacterium]
MAGSSTSVDIANAMHVAPVAIADWLVIMPSFVTIAGGAICLMLRKNTKVQPFVGIGFLTLLVAVNILLMAHVIQHGVITMVMGNWLPPFGIAFTVDALGATLSLIASIVAFCAGVYGSVTVDNTNRRYGFYPFLLFLLTGVSGAFLTGDVFNLYVWFEVLLISSYGLLVLGNERPQLDGSVKYGILNLIGTNLFLISTGLIYGMFGTLNMADLTQKIAALDPADYGPLSTIAALYLLAFAMKAAAFPVNFWLPASYHTPNIVVSAVFAGLLTKVGVYALLRIFVLLLPVARSNMSEIIVFLAIATQIMGALGALAQNRLNNMLGYLVIAGIGSMLGGIAVGTQHAISSTIFYAVHSILVMTGLYLVAGMMQMLNGSYELRKLGGLYVINPALAAVFLILSLSASGLPPFSGFWAKMMLVDSAFEASHPILAASYLISGFLTMVAIGRVWSFAFWRGGPEGTPDGKVAPAVAETSGKLPFALWLPVLILTGIVVYTGLQPELLMELVLRGANGVVEPMGYLRSVFGDPS